MPEEETTEERAGTASDDRHGQDEKTLEEQLAELKAFKEATEIAQVDTNLAELEKLLADAAKAQSDYDDQHAALQKVQDDLKAEFDTLDVALKAALGKSGPSIDNIKAAIDARKDAQSDAHDALKDARNALATAEAEAAETTSKLKKAVAVLDVWRKPVESITARHKAIAVTIKDVKDLRNKQKQAEAYWKLALGTSHAVDGQNFVDVALDAQPEVLAPDQLRARIRAKWNDLVAARTKEAEVAQELNRAKAAVKAAEAKAAAIDATLIKDITEDLAKL